VRLRWEQVDLKTATVFVKRLKSSQDGTHLVRGDKLRALRQLRREWPQTPYLFATERGGPMTATTARHIIERGRGVSRGSRSPCTPIGCAMRPGTGRPTRVWIPGQFRMIWATRTGRYHRKPYARSLSRGRPAIQDLRRFHVPPQSTGV
jgi:hypothetical protein